MNPTKYFHNRFSFAIKNNGTIKVNQQDIEAVNKLVESDKKRNTDLEDALLLFYLLRIYKLENDNNQILLKEKPLQDIIFPLGLSNPMTILEKLSLSLNPKEVVIKEIASEIWIYQEYERICKDQALRDKELNDIREGGGITTIEGNITTYYVSGQETIPLDKKATYDEVEKLLNELLDKAKNDLTILNGLSN